MTHPDSYELRDLSRGAFDYVNRRMENLWSDQDGVHARANVLRASSVAAYLQEPFEECFRDNFDWSNPSGNGNRGHTEELVAHWMFSPPAGTKRLCVVEDQLGRRKDGNWKEWGDVLYIDTPYHFSTADEVADDPGALALSGGGFFEQGFLCDVPDDFQVTDPLSETQITAVVDGIVGVAITCWDQEGMILVGLEGRWDPRDWA